MATEYYLICSSCKEFLDLHKFRLIPGVCDRSPLGIDGVSVSLPEIDHGISLLEPLSENNRWIHQLVPHIQTFSAKHAVHDLRMVDSYAPDYYWWPEHPGYTEWKEIVSSLIPNTEFFLPRNLVDDLQITNWETAEEYLVKSYRILYEELELKEYREKFDELIAKVK
ncbi:hypothetical protein D3C87_95660 [compost metagenome]